MKQQAEIHCIIRTTVLCHSVHHPTGGAYRPPRTPLVNSDDLSGGKGGSQKDRTAQTPPSFPLVPPSLKIIDIIYCRTGESGQPQTLALAQNRGGRDGTDERADGRADLSGTLEEVGP